MPSINDVVPNLHHGNNLMTGHPQGVSKGIHVSVINFTIDQDWVKRQYDLHAFIYIVWQNNISYLVLMDSDYAHFTSKDYSISSLRKVYQSLEYYTTLVKNYMKWTNEEISLIGYYD